MTKFKIYLSPPHKNGEEARYVQQALDSNWLAPVGPALDRFEQDLSDLHNNKPVLALNSGTAAIHLSLKLIGIKKGDFVLVASHTHNATVNPIIYEGGIPVLVDCDKKTWNMSPEHLRHAIDLLVQKGTKPKAILLVHLYGMPAQLNEILSIAEEHQIPLIEDAAEALGSTYKGRPLGTFGELGILSFNGNKIVTTSGGGALITSQSEHRQRALFLATQARDDAPHFQHSEIGYNYRLSNVLASLGTAQLKNLEARVAKRRAIFNTYVQLFEEFNQLLGEEVVSWLEDSPESLSNRWLSTFLIKPTQGLTRENWRLALEDAGIESRSLWKPMHLQPVFEQYQFVGEGFSEYIFNQGICLPSVNDLSEADQNEIVSVVKSLYLVN